MLQRFYFAQRHPERGALAVALGDRPLGQYNLTPLFHAVSSHSHATVALLLDRGANIGARHPSGSTALHVAIGFGAAIETIQLLLKRGAVSQIDVSNDFGYTPTRIAEARGRTDVLELLERARPL